MTIGTNQPQQPTITRVVARRHFNTGNYENVAFECEALAVNGDAAGAFATALAACDAAYAQFLADKEAAQQRERDERERQRQERIAAQRLPRTIEPDEDPVF